MLLLKNYTVLEELHAGNKTTVYRAVSLPDQHPVILKATRDDNPTNQEIASFQHEYHLLNQFNLEGVIHANALVKHENRWILVLEDVAGIPLKEFMAGIPLMLDAFFKVARQLIDIIGGLHKHQIIHKDIKPSNILIQPATLTVKITDLSISSQLSEEMLEYVNPQTLDGTLAYMSPEQTGRMNRAIDYRTDFYSLGVTFFEMLSGQLPFQANDAMEYVNCHVSKIPPLVTNLRPDVPDMLAAIIGKLLAKMPEDRYKSIIGLKADLTECAKLWRSKKNPRSFTLGQQDVYDHLHISQKLYGREAQIINLLSAIEKAGRGAAVSLLVSGYSGVGKTSLVREIYKPLINQRGYFISGKFDQLQRNIPYSAIIYALQSLVRQVLAEPEEQLAKIRAALLKTFDEMGQTIINIIPEIELIIGQQQKNQYMYADQNSFHMLFQNVIRVFAQAEHPLVIFLDDLQWIDSASLKLLEALLQDPDIHHFLLIGAYRDNEITDDHPLLLLLKALKQQQRPIQEIVLQPLSQPDIQHLLVDTFASPAKTLDKLTALLLEKTAGIPFAVNEFIKTLVQEKLIKFSYDNAQWQWNISEIYQQNMTDNVVDLLISKIQRLPEKTQDILKLAACIGHVFDLQTLATVSQQPLNETHDQLWQAVKQNLIKPGGGTVYRNLASDGNANFAETLHYFPVQITYHFTHDRVQQAAYALIPEEKKKHTHLQIGRLLRESAAAEHHNERHIFNLLQHFNKSLELITDAEEQLALAKINLAAALKAKASIAYQAAMQYAQAGITLLGQNGWENNFELMFELNRERAEYEYLLGLHDNAEQSFNALLKRARSDLEKADIYYIKMVLYTNMNQHVKCLEAGITALKLFGINLPFYPKRYHIFRELLVIMLRIGFKKVATLDKHMVETTDPKQVAIGRLLAAMHPAAYNDFPYLFGLISTIEVSRSLKYGYTADNLVGYLPFILILMTEFNLWKTAFAFADLSHRLINKINNPQIASTFWFIFCYLVQNWRRPVNEVTDSEKQGYQMAIDAGNLLYAGYFKADICSHIYTKSATIDEVLQETEYAIAALKRIRDQSWTEYCQFFQQAMLYCQGKVDLDFASTFNKISHIKPNTARWCYYAVYSEALFLIGDYPRALQPLMAADQLKDAGKGGILNQSSYTLRALTAAQLLNTASRTQKRFYWKIFNKDYRQLKIWDRVCPVNLRHKFLLVSAEKARLLGRTAQAATLYDAAIVDAREQGFVHYVAIANELAALFYLKQNNSKMAGLYMIEAYHAYQCWGAKRKLALLAKLYPEWLQISIMDDNKTTLSVTTLDYIETMKATHAIASEIQLDKLLQKLITILLESADAQRCVLLVKKNDIWVIEAEGTLNHTFAINLINPDPIENRDDLPVSIINHVIRTQQSMAIQDTSNDNQSMSDPYIERAKPKSILVMPVLYQGKLRRMLYMENNINTDAFSALHLKALQLLAAQAAISLENAALFYQVSHDPLTGLANANLLYQKFNQRLEQKENLTQLMAILFIDLDYFKTINDTLGQNIGDQLLLRISQQLKTGVREGDLIVRLGGDEFIILLQNLQNMGEATTIADKLYKQLEQPITLSGHELTVSYSMGISFYPVDGSDIQTLLKQADLALAQAKKNGRNQYQLYRVNLAQNLQERHNEELELAAALEHDELRLYYQPVLDTQTRKLFSIEALVRWQHPTRGLIAAKDFINLAEKTNLIIPIGEWIVRTACAQAKAWQLAGFPQLPMLVNFSAVQFKMRSPSQFITQVLQETGLDPNFLELELTESILIQDSNKIRAEINAMQALGIKFVIDDFGTYYNSLTYLRRIHFSKLKIDQTFVQGIEKSVDDKVIIQAIISMAHGLHLTVVAEGIETEAQLDFLRAQKVDAVQGYYFSHPLDKNAMEAFLTAQRDSTVLH